MTTTMLICAMVEASRASQIDAKVGDPERFGEETHPAPPSGPSGRATTERTDYCRQQ